MARSGSGISAIFASTSLSPAALFPCRARASAFSSWARSFIAARSSSVNPCDALPGAVVADVFVPFFPVLGHREAPPWSNESLLGEAEP